MGMITNQALAQVIGIGAVPAAAQTMQQAQQIQQAPVNPAIDMGTGA